MNNFGKGLLGLAAFALTASSFGQTINLATGLDSSGNVQTAGYNQDANWTVSKGNYYWNGSSDVAAGSGAAWTVDPSDPDWYGGWFANGPNSSWITSDPHTSNNGDIVVTRTFNLTAYQVANASISTEWQFSMDDEGIVLLNGNQIGSAGNGQWGGFLSMSVSDATLLSDLVAGTNTLQIVGQDSDSYLEASRFEGGLAVPAPEPMSMIALGLGAAALIRKRFRA